MNYSANLQKRPEGRFERLHHEAGAHLCASNAAAGLVARRLLIDDRVDALAGENLTRYRWQNTPKGAEA